MRRTFFIAAFLITVLPFSSFSQVMGSWEPFLSVGFKLGAHFQHLSGVPVKSNPGVVAGAYIRKDIRRFGIRAEALGSLNKYITKNSASYYSLYTPGMDTTSKGDFQAIYLNVPLLVEYKLNNKLQVLAGPQFSYVLSLSDNNNAYTKLYGDGNFISTTDFSVLVGLEYAATKRVQIGARLIKGVTDVNNSTYYLVYKKWSTAGAQVSVSYKIL